MKIGIIGSGTMGNGIAHSFASNGYNVLLHDIDEVLLSKGLDTIKSNLDRMLKKQKITDLDISNTIANISTTTSLDEMSDRDLIVEAATENLDIKLKIFSKLDSLTSDT